jgi:hypothetical protein
LLCWVSLALNPTYELLETLGSEIQMFLTASGGFAQEHALVHLLLQPASADEAFVSEILLPPD